MEHEDWAIELAKVVYKSEYDNKNLDLMAPPFAFDADTAIHVYAVLEDWHSKEESGTS